jgi:hypothetical protein
MLNWLRAEGVARVTLGTAPGTRAARFYEAAGWVGTGRDAGGEALYALDLG